MGAGDGRRRRARAAAVGRDLAVEWHRLIRFSFSARLEQESGCNVCRRCVLFTQHVTYSKTGLSVGEHLSLRSILAIRPIVGYKRRTEILNQFEKEL